MGNKKEILTLEKAIRRILYNPEDKSPSLVWHRFSYKKGQLSMKLIEKLLKKNGYVKEQSSTWSITETDQE